MEQILLLDKNEDVRSVEAQEQSRFILSVVEGLGIPFDHDPDAEFTVFDKIRLRKILNEYNVSVIDDMAGNVKIYLERELIAEWHKASYILKEDPSEIDRKKRYYLEMHCSFSCPMMENAVPQDEEEITEEAT